MSDHDPSAESAPIDPSAPPMPRPVSRAQLLDHWIEPLPVEIPPMSRWHRFMFELWLAIAEWLLLLALRRQSVFLESCGKRCLRRAFKHQRGLLPIARSDAFYKFDQ
jgi:hypothetical protein